MTEVFYGYKHWTLEDQPRCFNVGRGRKGRPESLARNHKWHGIVKRYGLRVEIIVGFKCGNHVHDLGEKCHANEEANSWEVEWVVKENTFSINHSHDDPNDIGCNFTRGGGGVAGWIPSEESKRKNSESNKISTAGEKNGMFGKKQKPETIAKIVAKNIGRKDSEETRLKKSKANTGRSHPVSEETKQKLSELRKGKSPWNKGKKFGPREIPREFSEQACKNISEGHMGVAPWNKGKKTGKRRKV